MKALKKVEKATAVSPTYPSQSSRNVQPGPEEVGQEGGYHGYES